MGSARDMAYDIHAMPTATRPTPEAFVPEGDRLSARTEALLDRADSLCVKRGVRMTALRRQVMGLMLESSHPLRAYDLLEQLQARHAGAAPPTVYRALDFLLEHGLAHKIERLSSFVPCVHVLDHSHDHDGDCAHATQFLICRTCARVTELEDGGIVRAIALASRGSGFHVQHSTIEIEGLCAECLASGTKESASLPPQ